MKEKEEKLSLPPVAHSLEGLHTALFDELNAVRSGAVSTVHARTFAQLTKQVIGVYAIQLVASGRIEAVRRLKKVEQEG